MARILVIDDESLQLSLRAKLLEANGHEVVALQNGKAAAELFKEQPFDLVITDLLMPMMTGFDLAQQLKQQWPSVPIILLTGWDKLINRGDLRAKVDLILSKPSNEETLIAAVNSNLGRVPIGSATN